VVVVALRFALNERLGVLGGYSELVERATGRVKALGWKSFFLIGVVRRRVALRSGGGALGRRAPIRLDRTRLSAPRGSRHRSRADGRRASDRVRRQDGRRLHLGQRLRGDHLRSPASFVATPTFFATAVGASFLLRGLFG
jgi:hypothetical protein